MPYALPLPSRELHGSHAAAILPDRQTELERLRSIAGVRRADEILEPDAGVVPSGHPALDAVLPGGGWPRGALTEVLQPLPALLEWQLLAPALATLARAGAAVVLVAPDATPNLPGLVPQGMSAKCLVWVRASPPAERLWATEQFVRSGSAGAVLAWLPQARSDQLRRLHLGAEGTRCLVFAMRPEQASREASAAVLRVAPRLDMHGVLRARIVKRRGPAFERELELSRTPAALSRLRACAVRQAARPPPPAGRVGAFA